MHKMFGQESSEDEDLTSYEGLAERLDYEKRVQYSADELKALAWNLSGHTRHYVEIIPKIRQDLEEMGYTLQYRGGSSRRVRGYNTSDHDRWYGPGSESCHGGSGKDQIAGFAGRDG